MKDKTTELTGKELLFNALKHKVVFEFGGNITPLEPLNANYLVSIMEEYAEKKLASHLSQRKHIEPDGWVFQGEYVPHDSNVSKEDIELAISQGMFPVWKSPPVVEITDEQIKDIAIKRYTDLPVHRDICHHYQEGMKDMRSLITGKEGDHGYD